MSPHRPYAGTPDFLKIILGKVDEMGVTPRAVNPALSEDTVFNTLKLRSAVELVPPESLPNDGLVIEDLRRYD